MKATSEGVRNGRNWGWVMDYMMAMESSELGLKKVRSQRMFSHLCLARAPEVQCVSASVLLAAGGNGRGAPARLTLAESGASRVTTVAQYWIGRGVPLLDYHCSWLAMLQACAAAGCGGNDGRGHGEAAGAQAMQQLQCVGKCSSAPVLQLAATRAARGTTSSACTAPCLFGSTTSPPSV